MAVAFLSYDIILYTLIKVEKSGSFKHSWLFLSGLIELAFRAYAKSNFSAACERTEDILKKRRTTLFVTYVCEPSKFSYSPFSCPSVSLHRPSPIYLDSAAAVKYSALFTIFTAEALLRIQLFWSDFSVKRVG